MKSWYELDHQTVQKKRIIKRRVIQETHSIESAKVKQSDIEQEANAKQLEKLKKQMMNELMFQLMKIFLQWKRVKIKNG